MILEVSDAENLLTPITNEALEVGSLHDGAFIGRDLVALAFFPSHTTSIHTSSHALGTHQAFEVGRAFEGGVVSLLRP